MAVRLRVMLLLFFGAVTAIHIRSEPAEAQQLLTGGLLQHTRAAGTAHRAAMNSLSLMMLLL